MNTNTDDWKRLLRGGFAFQTAAFASHPTDERFALAAISEAIRFGIDRSSIENEVVRYLSEQGCKTEFIKHQTRIFRKFFNKQYSEIRNCWVLFKEDDLERSFVAIFSGRRSLDDILYHSMHLYESREFNQATQLLRAKKKRWPIFRISFYKFPSGALWEGRSIIGSDPEYHLVRANAVLSSGLDPKSSIVWKELPIPSDPGPTWEGLRYSGYI